MLEVYPNAPLKDEMARAKWSQAPDDDVAAMYVTAMERLETAGYDQYEISNVARPGRQSRHNLKYWSDGEWLGFGCGAHSTRRAVRWKNVASTEEYTSGWKALSRPEWTTGRSRTEERLGDALFTGLRLTDGVNLDAIRAVYGVDVWDTIRPRTGTVSSGGAAAPGGHPDVADASGNASCSRSHDYFRLALELVFGLEYRSFVCSRRP